MAQPPEFPIMGNKDYFDIVLEQTKPFFVDTGITLDFSNYKETMREYSNLDSCDYEQLWKLGKELSVWGEYISNILAITEKFYLDAETEEKTAFAIASTKEDGIKVANGDRLANKSTEVIQARRNKNILKSFMSALENKKDFVYKAHHYCKSSCDWNKKQTDC